MITVRATGAITAWVMALLVVAGRGAAGNNGFTTLGWYPFADGTADDASGNGNDGSLFGDPTMEPGIVDQALRLDGNDYIVVPDDPMLHTDTLSLSLWLRIDSVPAGDQMLISKVAGQQGYRIWINGPEGTITFALWVGPGMVAAATSPYPVFTDVWTSVFATYDGLELKLYLHGSLAATKAAAGATISSDTDLLIGSTGVSKFFVGLIDEVVIGEGAAFAPDVCDGALKLWDPISLTCIDRFTDVTDILGVGDYEHKHFGICVVDINNDGWVDLYYQNGRQDPVVPVPPSGTCPDLDGDPKYTPANLNVCYLNQGDGTFGPDIAPQAGIDDFWFAMRHAWGDYDNDGLRDLISHNFIRSPLYHAISGPDPLLYEDASEASGLNICLTAGTGAAWVDLDNDGWLDMYAVEYQASRPPEEHVNLMYLNNRDGTFVDITSLAGVDLPDNPMGVTFADYDNDGDQDVYVTNSHEAPSRLYRNDGVDADTGVPYFTDVAVEAGVAVVGEQGRGFGAAWGDYNNDGRLDLLFVREADTRLFRNDGPDKGGTWTFTNVTDAGGLVISGITFRDGNFADLDNDGWLDILLAAEPGDPNRVFLNNQDETWREVSVLVGMDLLSINMMGVVPGDTDNDGDVDILWGGWAFGEANYLFRNDTRGNNWVQFRLTGTVSNRDAVGARIEVTATLQPGEGPVTQIREVCAGTGFFSDMPRIQTFGLSKAAEVTEATIRWPSGLVQDLEPLAINQRYDFTESGAPGDLNLDGTVGTADLLMLLAAWGPCPAPPEACPADIDGDGVVATSDLLILLANWG